MICCVELPSFINSWMDTNNNANAHTPLLDIVGSFKIVHPRIVPLKNFGMINGDDRLHAFYYNHVHLKRSDFHITKLPCHGQLCDALDLYKNGRRIDQCTSIYSISRLGLLSILVQLEVIVINPEEHKTKRFTVKDFTSRSFTLEFLEDGIPTGVTERMINQNWHY